MKNKKDSVTRKQEQTTDALADVIEELDDETLNKVTGAGGFNPFGDASRVPLQEIPDELREKA
jgi:hypothetical protein